MEVEKLIKKLKLESHPEGGYFAEVERSGEVLEENFLADRYEGTRNIYTSIYFLLEKEEKSNLHRLKSDEIWYFHSGSPVLIHIISGEGNYTTHLLGNNILGSESAQFTIPRGSWFGAEIVDKNSYALVSCMVAPGFDFRDFELASRVKLMEMYPDHGEIIKYLTREE